MLSMRAVRYGIMTHGPMDLQAFLSTLSRWTGAAAPESPWERVPMPVPARAFGPGSHRPFAEYFEGDSGVPVASIDDIVAWLKDCAYVSDPDLFHEPDVWQHPADFEQRRR